MIHKEGKNTMIPELSIVWGGGIMLICICSAAFIGFLAVRETKTKNNIESALSKNYTGYTNYYGENTFVYDGEKYSFEYNLDTNTLTVFTENGTMVDGVYVDGIYVQGRHKNDISEDVSETALESKAVDTSDNTSEEDSATVSEDNSNLSKRIQSIILERYTDALITSYDTDALSGTFESGGISYTFSWSDNLLEVTEVENPDNVVYVKITE